MWSSNVNEKIVISLSHYTGRYVSICLLYIRGIEVSSLKRQKPQCFTGSSCFCTIVVNLPMWRSNRMKQLIYIYIGYAKFCKQLTLGGCVLSLWTIVYTYQHSEKEQDTCITDAKLATCYPSANREARNPKKNRYTFILFQNDNHTKAKAHILYISVWIALEMLSTILGTHHPWWLITLQCYLMYFEIYMPNFLTTGFDTIRQGLRSHLVFTVIIFKFYNALA